MMISWYDKKVMSAIVIGLVLITAGIIVTHGVVTATEEVYELVIVEGEFAMPEVEIGEDPLTVLRETFLDQTNNEGNEILWIEYIRKSETIPCYGNCREGVEYIIRVPVIEERAIGSDQTGR